MIQDGTVTDLSYMHHIMNAMQDMFALMVAKSQILKMMEKMGNALLVISVQKVQKFQNPACLDHTDQDLEDSLREIVLIALLVFTVKTMH